MNAFERHPRLAAWMERLANANIEGMTLIAWDDFCSAVNEVVFPTPPQPADGEVVKAMVAAHEDEWERWINRDARGMKTEGDAIQVCRFDDSGYAGFSEIHNFATWDDAQAAFNEIRATRSMEAALAKLETPS